MGYFPSISGNNHVVIILVIVIVVIIVIAVIIKLNRQRRSKHSRRNRRTLREDDLNSKHESDSDHYRVDMSPQSHEIIDRKKTHHNSTPAPVQPNMNKISKPLMANSNIHVHRTYNILPYKRKNGSTTGPMRRHKSSNLPVANSQKFKPLNNDDSAPTLGQRQSGLFGQRQLNRFGLMGLNMISPENIKFASFASNFSLTATPSTVSISPGGVSANSTIKLITTGSGAVGLYVQNIPSGVTVATTSNSLSASNSSAVLTFTASSKARIQNTVITIIGYSLNKVYRLSIHLNVTGTTSSSSFSLSANPNTATVTQGGKTTSTVTVTPISGFSGVVNFSVNGLPTGTTASFGPAALSTNTTLTLTSSLTASTGTKTIIITGKSGSLTETTTLLLTVNLIPLASNFVLSLNPGTLTVIKGGIASASVLSVYGVNSFFGSVALSVTGLPSGVTAIFSPSSATLGISNTNSNPVTTTLTLTASSSATIGSTTSTITGKSTNLMNDINLGVIVNSATIAPPSPTPSVIVSHSQNWSGYVSATSLTNPITNSCTFVSGTFIIPSLSSGVTLKNNNVSLWVGLDGAFSSDPTVQQIGVDLEYVGGQTIVYAWYEMYPAYTQEITGFPANVGDEIIVSARVLSVTGNTVVYALTIDNVTQNESVTIPASETTTNSGLQQSAEWIVEAPAIGNTIVPLSDFSPITWTNCTATIGGVTGGIGTFTSELIDMVSSHNVPEATTSSLNSTGNGFSVNWNSP